VGGTVQGWEVLAGRLGLVGEFLALFALVYAATLSVMLVTGFAVMAANRRHPERRIQRRETAKNPIDEIRSSLVPLAVTSLCLTLGLFAQGKGWALSPVKFTWWSIPLFIPVLVALQDAWFYWTHRLLHTKPLYRFHKRHHMTIAPTVLSSDDSTVVDTVFAHTFYALVPFVMPVPALVILLHRLLDQVSGMIGHAGFEHFASATTRKPWPFICTVFHDQHHQHFVYNYGIYTSVWDRVCGTLHSRYDEKVREFEAICADQATRTRAQ
jgi:sterol desaturase/sphingolipid hydroxylase (fatty acid hydroxylase superfamily)